MGVPSFLKGESLTRLLQGTALGAVAAMIIGFNWGGWTLESTSAKNTEDKVKTELVSALAPICVGNFESASDAVANLEALINLPSYKRSGFIDDGGWAILDGGEKAKSGVASACADLLVKS